jgi:hypothetical protein
MPFSGYLYLFENNLKSFYCFKSNGELLTKSKLPNSSEKDLLCSSAIHFKDRFVFCDEYSKLLIFI